MKIKNLFLTVATMLAGMAAMAQTDGFSYQAVVRDANGELVKSQKVGLLLTIADNAATNVMYKESQTPSTNEFGVLSVTVGSGKALDGTKLSNVDWTKPAWLHIAIDTKGGTNYVDLGATKIQAVPVALYAARSGNSEQAVGVTNPTTTGDALFEVKDKDGNVVFAVYPNGVHVYIDPEAGDDKLRRSGFLVTGRETTKDGEPNNYFAVNGDGTQVYVDNDDTKLRRSGFLVTGRETTKDGVNNDFMSINGDGTKVFVDNDDTKLRRSGFLVTGRETTKDGDSDSHRNDFMSINGDGTKVFVDDDDTKLRRSGFLVTGRETTKEGTANNYFAVNDEGTKVFVDDDDSKLRRSGFLVTGRETTKDDDKGAANKYLSVGDDGTKIYIDDQLEEDSKLRRSGFLVTGRETTKDGSATNYMKVATNGTLVHFDDDASKLRRSGFLVTGRETTKGTADEYMTINTDSTRFYINGGSAKGDFGVASREDGSKADSGNGGFAVSGRDDSKSTANNLFNIDLATTAKTLNEENRIYWYPEKNAFMAGNLTVEHPDSVGTNSFNAGYQNKAIGEYSQAFGYKSVATGKTSIAIGDSARSAGKSSFAFGRHSVAIGDSSVAIGSLAIAKDTNAYAFGNGAKALAPGSYAIGTGATTSGANAVSIGTEANATKEDAYAFGYKAQATGKSSLALGAPSIRYYDGEHGVEVINYDAAKAEGDFSYAIGSGTEALEDGTVAIGVGSKATYAYDVAIGGGEAKGGGALVIGASVAEGILSTAVGYKAKATGMNSTAIGSEAKAIGDGSIALGAGTEAKKSLSTAIGHGTIAEYSGETVVGRFNTTGNSYYHDKLFVVGNGDLSDGTRSDAMVVLDNGNLIVGGDLWPSKIPNDVRYSDIGSGDWNMWFNRAYITNGVQLSSDQRLKTDIKPLEKALDKVLTLNGVTYEWRVNEFPNKNFDSNRHVGVIAQEVEAVLPEAVETGGDGYKSVNYSNLTPLLIEAIKEQQTIISNQQQQIDELKKMVEELMKKQ